MSNILDTLERTTEGYLVHIEDWTPEIAKALAAEENIELTAEHWLVIEFLREFYSQYTIAPAMRPLVKALKNNYGEDKGNSIYLAKLFPSGAAKQANKIAGLPKPVRCI